MRALFTGRTAGLQTVLQRVKINFISTDNVHVLFLTYNFKCLKPPNLIEKSNNKRRFTLFQGCPPFVPYAIMHQVSEYSKNVFVYIPILYRIYNYAR